MTDPAHAGPQPQAVGDIRKFLLAAEALPSPQGTALKLIEIARDPDAALADVVHIVRSDPALTGFVLRAASSARFGGKSGSLDLPGAVQRLGLDVIRAHALVLSLITQRGRAHCEGFDYPRFWIGALHTGILTEALALRCVTRPDGDPFSLGLLADIGRLAFATAAPRQYADLLARAKADPGTLGTLERQAFGFDHHELSAVLLADWQLPTALADIVYWQRDPEGGGFTAGSPRHRMASVLQLATDLSRAALDWPADPDTSHHDTPDLDHHTSKDADALAAATLRATILELDTDEMRAILSDSLPTLRDWATLVGLPMPSAHYT